MAQLPELTAVRCLSDELYRTNSGLLRWHEPLAKRTTYRVGGPAEILYSPNDETDIVIAVNAARRYGVPFRILGGGSNILISDAGVPGLTIEMKSFLNAIRIDGDILTAAAGASLLQVVCSSVQRGLGGLESLVGIPGTVGGGLRMNCGAFGSELSDCLESVQGVTSSGEPSCWMRSEITWDYRSAAELRDVIVTSARFRLTPRPREELRTRIREVLQQRRERQPLEFPSAGSVFKRPPGDFAGRLIDAAGLKGMRIGDAEVSFKHGGFIVNRGSATASEIRALIEVVRSRVRESFGVSLELEQVLWGFDDVP